MIKVTKNDLFSLYFTDPKPGTTPTTPYTSSVEIGAKSGASRRGIRRRPRTVYTAHQMEGLESVFAANQYPDINSREALADALDMTEARVQVRITSKLFLIFVHENHSWFVFSRC